jgi:hypothetical protein
MTSEDGEVFVYQLRVGLREISPAIWRRLLVRSDSTMADLHYILQIAMGWTDMHLHQFVIRGKRYGVPKIGGIFFADDPHQVRLGDFQFRQKERFVYEYDFGDLWQHDIRVERELPLDPKKIYPVCIGGARQAPPEDCGGPWAFMELKQRYTPWYIGERLLDILESEDLEEYREDYQQEARTFLYWLNADKLSRRPINRALKQYASDGQIPWEHEHEEVILR